MPFESPPAGARCGGPARDGGAVITHYQRLDELQPDKVHIIVDGTIIESGGMELAEELERDGYVRFGV